MDLGYLAAVVVLGGIILFHEFGHYLLARLNGIAVVEFSVGFGPRLLSWVSKKTGIRYSLKLLPLGGSCAMLGEFGEDEDEKEDTSTEIYEYLRLLYARVGRQCVFRLWTYSTLSWRLFFPW